MEILEDATVSLAIRPLLVFITDALELTLGGLQQIEQSVQICFALNFDTKVNKVHPKTSLKIYPLFLQNCTYLYPLQPQKHCIGRFLQILILYLVFL